jgi:hypothetical protein
MESHDLCSVFLHFRASYSAKPGATRLRKCNNRLFIGYIRRSAVDCKDTPEPDVGTERGTERALVYVGRIAACQARPKTTLGERLKVPPRDRPRLDQIDQMDSTSRSI